jgi:hypothetical protein
MKTVQLTFVVEDDEIDAIDEEIRYALEHGFSDFFLKRWEYLPSTNGEVEAKIKDEGAL